MKTTYLITIALLFSALQGAYAQNSNPWPTSTNVGIGTTTSLSHKLNIFNSTGTNHLNISGGSPCITFANTLPNNIAQGFIGIANTAGHFLPTSVQGDLVISTASYQRTIRIGSQFTGIEGIQIQNNGNVGINWGSFGNLGLPNKLTIYSTTSNHLALAGTNPTILGLQGNTGPYGGQMTFVTVADNTFAGSKSGDIAFVGSSFHFGKVQSNISLMSIVNDPATGQTNGFVAIGFNPGVAGGPVTTGYKLAVKGKIICEELKVKLAGNWPDYVFNKNYQLMPLAQLETYIESNHHLPEVPSANEVETGGVEVGNMNAILLKKVEELTLYMIEQNKKLEAQSKEIDALKLQVR